ncbi:MAG: hypothetical protein V3W44_10095 [Dehalococcoidales bacterium]
MAIKAKYATEDEVPEAHKELYEERQGEWILAKIDGLVTDGDIHRLSTANTKLRTENTKLKSQVDGFGGRTGDEILKLDETIEELKAQVEAGSKPDEEKINTLVEARTKVTLGPLQRDLKKAQDELLEKTKVADDLQTTITKGIISDHVRTAATKAKVVPTAVEDVLALSGGIFEVVDVDGVHKVVTKDKVGVAPGLDPDAYFAEVAPNKPHWFPGSQGAGANGGKNFLPGLNGKNPWSREHWNLTERGKILREHGPEKAEQYAKAAGSTLNATQPPKAKA